jgi:hypothetical protein
MAHQNQKYLSSMAWSSYALEDLGDSYVGDPDPSSCNTASTTARSGEVIRHVSDQLITLSCSNKVRLPSVSEISTFLNSIQLIFLFHSTYSIPLYFILFHSFMYHSISFNRPYRLFAFHSMDSFSCQILTHVLCSVGLKITLLLSLRTARNKFVQENMGIQSLSAPDMLK